MSQQNEQMAVLTIEVAMTQQAEAYTSTKRGAIVPIFVRPSDDVMAIFREKLAEITHQIEEAIDEDFEKGYNKPAKYSSEGRFDYIECKEEKLIVIIPVNQNYDPSECPNGWHNLSITRSGHRLKIIKQKLGQKQQYKDYTILDCSADFEPLLALPEIFKAAVSWNETQGIVILTKERDEALDKFKKEYWGYWDYKFETGFYETVLAKATKLAETRKLTLYVCWDGDFSQVPPPLSKPEPQDEDFEEDDEDEEDDE